jgi:hypothetical protein
MLVRTLSTAFTICFTDSYTHDGVTKCYSHS